MTTPDRANVPPAGPAPQDSRTEVQCAPFQAAIDFFRLNARPNASVPATPTEGAAAPQPLTE